MHYDKQKLNEICRTRGISYLALFGSRARGDFKPASDVDLLVDYFRDSPVKGLISHIGVAQEFEDLFNKPVDLIERNILKPELKSYIEQDLQTLYRVAD